MTAIYKYKKAMRWFTRPKVDPSVKQLATSNPLNIPAHMQHQMEGGQLTPEEFYQNQSIPITERPLTGAEGGRVQYKPGGLVEPGVTHYGTKDIPVSPKAQKLVDDFLKQSIAEGKTNFKTITELAGR